MFIKRVEAIGRLEMFFYSLPKMTGFSYFTNLREISIIAQDITRIEGLEFCVTLEILWVCECKLSYIGGLDQLTALRKLFLYSNNIKKISGLSNLTKLDTLWLCENDIYQIEGLDNLLELRYLNLASNKISIIPESIKKNLRLRDLNLANNNILDFRNIPALASLSRLQKLNFFDPDYGSNPVCLLSNYTTHVLYHLPTLQTLDNADVSAESLRQYTEAVVTKKKMYYNMRIKTLKRNTADVLRKLKQEKRNKVTLVKDSLADVFFQLKGIEREVELTTKQVKEIGDSDEEAIKGKLKYMSQLKEKQRLLNERVKSRNQQVKEMETMYEYSREHVLHMSTLNVRRLLIELQTGGNVRFEDGKPTDIWYSSCVDLMYSRFHAKDFEEFDIMGVKVNRITRVHNRLLRSRFESAIEKSSPRGKSKADSKYHKRFLEYLFFVWHPEMGSEGDVLTQILEKGFPTGAEFGAHGIDHAVPLCNSVFICDKTRILHHMKKKENDVCSFRFGHLIVAKVYLARPCEENGASNLIKREDYPNFNCVYRVHPEINKAGRQREWFVFNEHLVLPEYIVDFEYVVKQNRLLVSGSPELNNPNKDILDMFPLVPERDKMDRLTVEAVQKHTCQNSDNIQTINFYGCKINTVGDLTGFKNLRKLILSFNNISKLDGFNNLCNLEYLDLEFNRLKRIEGLRGIFALKTLLLGSNMLHRPDDVYTIAKNCPDLKELDIRDNLYEDEEGLRMVIIRKLGFLEQLDGSIIAKEEREQAAQVASTISLQTIYENSSTQEDVSRSLNLCSGAQNVSANSRPHTDDVDSIEWQRTVTSINLDHLGIRRLGSLENFSKLKWATICDNSLSRIEGLQKCTKLEELLLEGNSVLKLDGVKNLVNLKRLDVSNNRIGLIENLDNLANLQQLSLENNMIISLSGLRHLENLTELYIGNNNISNMKEIYHLKELPKLIIVDMFGNPISYDPEYRLFVIYHLKKIKVLDGAGVEASEHSLAKEQYGGRLTADFLAEKIGHSNFEMLTELDLPHANIKEVKLSTGLAPFVNLRSLNLEHNNLTNLGSITMLENLKVLCLNHNKIESLIGPASNIDNDSHSTVLHNLEVLHLGYNGISNIPALQLWRLPRLKTLFLQGNEIVKVEGLENLFEMRELVLDKNKIKQIGENAFGMLTNLRELHLEENRMKDLSNFNSLRKLQHLYLGQNRVHDIYDIEKLLLPNLLDLSLVSNPVTRKQLYRMTLIFHLRNLMLLDCINVSPEERLRADAYFIEQHGNIDYLQGLGSLKSFKSPPPTTNNPPPYYLSIHSLNNKQDDSPRDIRDEIATTVMRLNGTSCPLGLSVEKKNFHSSKREDNMK